MSFRNLAIAASLAALLACGRARAQAPEPRPEPAAAGEAHAAVARAKELFEAKNYGAALAEYTRALELLDGHPARVAVLNNIAVCYERMFRYDLALRYYEAYLREADASAEDRAEVERLVATLRALLGTVRITGVHAGEIWIDDRKLDDAPLDLLLPAGFHVIEVRARGYEPERRELRVIAGAVHEVHIALQPIDTYRGLPPTYTWIGVGLTTVAVVTGSALGIAALAEHEDGQRDARRGLHVDGQGARDLALQADIAFGAAIALGVGTVVMAFLTDWGATAERARAPPAVAPVVARGFIGASFGGQLP